LTTRAPIPAHPRLGARLAYQLQRIMRPRPGLRWLSARIEASGLARPLFTKTEHLTKPLGPELVAELLAGTGRGIVD
jgi:hypothetical protein